MRPESALAILVLAAALAFSRPERRGRAGRRIRIGCLLVLAWALLRLAQQALEHEPLWGLRGRYGSDTGVLLQHRAAAAALVAFAFLACALLALQRETARALRWATASAAVAALVGGVALIGYFYGAQALYTFTPFSSMAAHTALSCLALGIGTMGAAARDRTLHVFTSSNAGSRMLRSLFPFAVGLPLAAGWLCITAARLGLYDIQVGIGLGATLHVLLFSVLVWRSAERLNRSDTERQRIEAQLRSSEGRFRAMAESLPQLVWSCEPGGACDYLSPRWVEYTGVPEQEQLGFGSIDRVHPEDRQRTLASWKAVAPSGLPLDIEHRIRRHDGAYRWFKTLAVALRDGDGQIVKWFGSNTDIQDLRDAREKLSRLNQELEQRVQTRTIELERARLDLELVSERARLATRAVAMGIWDWNVRTDELVWDEGMYRLYGVQSESFSGASEAWRAALHPEDRATAVEVVQRALAGSAGFDTAFRIVAPGGQVRHIRGMAQVYRDAQGLPLRMIGINLDITEQRNAELALRASEGLLREFVRHAPAAIAMLDQRMCYLQASERWLKDYGLGSLELLGRCHYDVFPSLPERWREKLARVLEGAVEAVEEDRVSLPNGRVEWVQWEARPWRNVGGSVGGVLLFSQLISSRKSLELTLKRQAEELERSNRDLEQFAYVASHDLQEPLRAVTGCAQVLERNHASKLDGQAKQLISHIVEGGVRMQALILDLLAYSRVGTHGLQFAKVDSSVALQRALDQLQGGIVETSASVESEPLPVVHADGVQLTQLFQNLIGNALKYHGAEPPEIQIGCRQQGGSWEFFVRDNGIGIDPQYHERIFEIFQRLHTRREYAGTGIGLAICHKIVERHGGRIWVESRLGSGATFRFSLPAGLA